MCQCAREAAKAKSDHRRQLARLLYMFSTSVGLLGAPVFSFSRHFTSYTVVHFSAASFSLGIYRPVLFDVSACKSNQTVLKWEKTRNDFSLSLLLLPVQMIALVWSMYSSILFYLVRRFADLQELLNLIIVGFMSPASLLPPPSA